MKPIQLTSRRLIGVGSALMLVMALAGGWSLVRREDSVSATAGGRFAAYQPPAGAPTADIHPDTLNLQASFAQVAGLVKPAVVSISTVRLEQAANMPQFFFGDPMERFFDDFYGGPGGAPPSSRRKGKPRSYRAEGVGSGVIIDPDGLVLTNEHVVRDADEIKVLVYDAEGGKKDYKGTVVGKDARTDLAVVRVQAGHKLPFAALGDSAQVKVGDWAIAIGSPFGLSQTVTVGIISAARQSLVIEDKEYRNLIQTDAAINRGNSGGPLLNIRGEVVGINSAIFAPTGVFAGIGFAVPINQAKSILDDLVKRGRVVRGWLGVGLRPIDAAMAAVFGLPDEKGALVNEVIKGSPAEKAGLRRGDVVRRFDGKDVKDPADLQTLVAETAPKKSVPLDVVRNRQPVRLTLVTGERPESADVPRSERPSPSKRDESAPAAEWLGANVIAVSPELTENFGQPREAEGVLVIDVEPGSTAEEAGLLAGDIIRAVNQAPVRSVADFRRETSRLNLKKGFVLDVLRQGKPLYLSLVKKD